MFMSLPDIIILAGGSGSRLREAVPDLPKPMAPINNKPFLEYQLDFIHSLGFKRVIFSTGYLGQVIETFFGDSYKELELEYAAEPQPMGTGGAIKFAFSRVQTPHFMVMNGDTMFNIDLDKFFQKHVEELAPVSVALRKVSDASRYGTVKMNRVGVITSFAEKLAQSGESLINGGIYLFASRFFKKLNLPEIFSAEKDLFPELVKKEQLYGQAFDAYFLDIGIPEDYKRAQHEFLRFKY
jgi:D-glycero-alpha-D-manno-heptose 1-phosphate guanylyltransferase